jgi:AmmeMemoRadiSam system protein B
MLPHAGYMYSGAIAARTVASMAPKRVFAIIGPNHTGLGHPFSITASDSWRTPLGDVKVDAALADRIIKDCREVRKDELAHIHEHSVEVQLPLLQKLYGAFSFVPIVAAPADLETYRRVGSCLAAAVKSLGIEKDTVIIASSDMTHYEEQKSAEEKDSRAIRAILALDEKALVECVEEFDITMCGCGPAAIMLTAAKKLGAKSARLVKYATSGDVSGDFSSVVGYAGVIIN